MSQLKPGTVFALGNPLLDISAEVTPDFLQKYGLKPNNAILADESHAPMYKEMIENFSSVQFIPGGATLNSIRYAQWLIGSKCPRATVYVGCVGKDDYAKTLTELCTRDQVNVQFMTTDEAPTGTCGVCITGHDRSLVANLAAANLYSKKSHLSTVPVWKLVQEASIFYSSGFPLTVTPDGMLAIAEHACETNKVYCTNLSAEFICEFFKDQMSPLLPLTDYLFGNETEAAKFAAVRGGPSGGDVREIAKWISTLPKTNTKRERVVIFTQGLEPVIVASGGKVILEAPIEKLSDDKLVDTNGAGDSFVGGFLAGLAQGLSLEQCVRLGNSAAKYCIQMPGSVFVADQSSQVNKDAGL